MASIDTRSLSDDALEALRTRAVAMHEAGHSQVSIAAALGTHQNTIGRWLKTFRSVGAAGLKRQKRGRRPIEQRILNPAQEAKIKKLITDKCPDQLKLPFALWTREAVRDLIKARFDVTLALRTITDYLKRWGFTPQRPMKRATERQDAKIEKWLRTDYPKIKKRAKKEGAVIHWGDETGLSNQANDGRSFAPKGQTLVIQRTGKRHTTSMISSITNRGTARFMIYEGALNADLFLTFLKRLIKAADRKVFLIVDNLRVHKPRRSRPGSTSIKTGSSCSSSQPMRLSTIPTSSSTTMSSRAWPDGRRPRVKTPLKPHCAPICEACSDSRTKSNPSSTLRVHAMPRSHYI